MLMFRIGNAGSTHRTIAYCVRAIKLALEPVKLQLIKSYCLPYLTYCIGALQLSETKLRELNVRWNDAFRRVFGFKRY